MSAIEFATNGDAVRNYEVLPKNSENGEVAALLPDFLAPVKSTKSFIRVNMPKIDSITFSFYFAWNPRLLRLNPHAIRKRDWLANALCEEIL